MSRIDHLVLAGPTLEELRASYAACGFTVCPPGRHPFGTHNSVIQLRDRTYLELLAVAEPANVPEHRPGQFSFAAFNRDFLARHPHGGFSMLVLNSLDACADAARYHAAGIGQKEPFDFARTARLPDGAEVEVAFALAFTNDPQMRDAGFFACQHHAPQYFWNPAYQTHDNGVTGLAEVALVCERPADHAAFLAAFMGPGPRPPLVLMTPDLFGRAYGVAAPDVSAGPRLAGFLLAGGRPPVSGTVRGRDRLTLPVCGVAVAFADPAG